MTHTHETTRESGAQVTPLTTKPDPMDSPDYWRGYWDGHAYGFNYGIDYATSGHRLEQLTREDDARRMARAAALRAERNQGPAWAALIQGRAS